MYYFCIYIYMISGFPSFNLLQKKHTRPPKKKQQPLWDVPTCKPVSCTATIAFIVREGSSRSKARRLYLGPTAGGTQKHSCECCWRQDERLSFFVTLFFDFVVPFFLGEGEGPSLFFFTHDLKEKVSKNMRKLLFPTHPSERKPRCSTRCPASKKATSTSRFSTSEASKSAWPSRFPVAIG